VKILSLSFKPPYVFFSGGGGGGGVADWGAFGGVEGFGAEA